MLPSLPLLLLAASRAPTALASAAAAAPPPPAPVAPPHSVSGFSGGASMAVNHLVAFADVVEGMGIIGGSPYGCNQVPDCGNSCSGFQSSAHLENTSIPWDDWVDGLRVSYLAERARAGRVAALSHLVGKPVYLFSGLDDVYVYQSVMRAVDYQFRNLSARVKSEFSLYAAHAWVVDNETCSGPGEAALGHKPEEHAACCGIKGQVGACAFEGKGVAPYRPQGCCGACSAGDVSAMLRRAAPETRTHTRTHIRTYARSLAPSCYSSLSVAARRMISATTRGFQRLQAGDRRSTTATTTCPARYSGGSTAPTR
jgi:hypothetical protein